MVVRTASPAQSARPGVVPVLVALWSAKGGSGTTVVATALATVLARSSPSGAVVVDLAGDVPTVLGVPEPDRDGVAQWLAAGPEVAADGPARLEVPVGNRPSTPACWRRGCRARSNGACAMSRDLVTVVHRRLVAEDVTAPRRRGRIDELVRAEAPLLDDAGARAVAEAVAAKVGGLGPLEPLLADPAVTEIMVNGGPVWVERAGELERVDLVLDMADVFLLIERVLAPLGLRIDRTAPYVDARLADGSRVNAVIPPLSLDGPCLTIRRFRTQPIELDDLAAPDVVALLRASVHARANVVVSG